MTAKLSVKVTRQTMSMSSIKLAKSLQEGEDSLDEEEDDDDGEEDSMDHNLTTPSEPVTRKFLLKSKEVIELGWAAGRSVESNDELSKPPGDENFLLIICKLPSVDPLIIVSFNIFSLDWTSPTRDRCPSNFFKQASLFGLQTRTVPSRLPENI